MPKQKQTYVRWSREKQEKLIAGARDATPVAGLTHNFYRYPARFSPSFARASIECLSKPGDLILDPFVGGGTSLVEALALGRHGIGVDISSLAEFVTKVKTTILTDRELDSLAVWAEEITQAINIRLETRSIASFAEAGYYKHMNTAQRWRLRKCIEQGIWSAQGLDSARLETFARCAVLRTAQWALDGRKKLPTVAEFRQKLLFNAHEMIDGVKSLAASVRKIGTRASVRIMNRPVSGLENDHTAKHMRAPKLIVTSPPYPGVHILYHRWQVDGRKEAPLPFMIADKLDGAGSSYYTMGDRKYPELKTYFDNIRATMSSLAAIANSETVIVQMIAFSNPDWQLKRYLETMQAAGWQEMLLPLLKQEELDGRLWRSVPGRRWYSDQRGETPGSNEVVLIHRKWVDAPRHRAAKQFTSRQHPLI